VIDDALATWHSDGTEIMNSSKPPISQSWCMGVWKTVGPRTSCTTSRLVGPTRAGRSARPKSGKR
jgi:hypothetical protein